MEKQVTVEEIATMIENRIEVLDKKLDELEEKGRADSGTYKMYVGGQRELENLRQKLTEV